MCSRLMRGPALSLSVRREEKELLLFLSCQKKAVCLDPLCPVNHMYKLQGAGKEDLAARLVRRLIKPVALSMQGGSDGVSAGQPSP